MEQAFRTILEQVGEDPRARGITRHAQSRREGDGVPDQGVWRDT